VTEVQVRKAITKAKKSSAVDLNGVSPEMLKLSGEKIIPQLTHVINMSIRSWLLEESSCSPRLQEEEQDDQRELQARKHPACGLENSGRNC
jgi:hypothetical protein